MYCLKSPLNFIARFHDGPKCRTVRGCLLGRHYDREAANHESDGSSWRAMRRLRVGLFNIRYPSANLTPASLSYRKPCGAVRFRRRGRAKQQQSDVFVEVVGIGVCQELFCNLPRSSHKIERFVLSAQELVDGVPKRPFSSHLTHTHSRAVMWEGSNMHRIALMTFLAASQHFSH